MIHYNLLISHLHQSRWKLMIKKKKKLPCKHLSKSFWLFVFHPLACVDSPILLGGAMHGVGLQTANILEEERIGRRKNICLYVCCRSASLCPDEKHTHGAHVISLPGFHFGDTINNHLALLILEHHHCVPPCFGLNLMDAAHISCIPRHGIFHTFSTSRQPFQADSSMDSGPCLSTARLCSL